MTFDFFDLSGQFACQFVCRSLKPAAKQPKRATAKDAESRPVWQQRVNIRVTAMVRAGDTILVAGSSDVCDPADPHGAWEGGKGGRLAAFAAADGKKLCELELPVPPVWDGMAAAGGRLLVALADGNVMCLQEKQ